MSSVDKDEILINMNKWVADLDSINVNNIHPKVKCELLMVVEEISSFTKIIKMLQVYSSIIMDKRVLTISTKDIYDFVYDYPKRQRYWDDQFCEITYCACSEAYVYIHIQKPIPVDLLVKLIKLKVISVIKEIVFRRRKEATLRQQMDYFRVPNVDRRDGKKKGKKKEKVGNTKKGKAKKGKISVAVVNPCLDFQYIPSEDILPDQNVDIPSTFVYIALTGFYMPNLIPFCYWNGIPLQCIIRFGETKIKYNRHASETTVDSVHYDDDYLILKPDVKYAPRPQFHKKKEQVLLHFWRRINLMYNVEKPEFVKDSFIMSFCPYVFSVDKKNTKLYLHLCEQLYEDFSEFVEKLADYKRQYRTYIENMNVYQLDVRPKKVEIYQMEIYNDAIDAIPIDAISISLILDSLIEEVCHRTEKTGFSLNMNKCTPETTDKHNIKKQSHYFEIEDMMCHRSLRDQLKNIFLHFKMTRCRYLPKTMNFINSIGPSVNNKPYITHESNLIEMTLNYYKFVPRSILDTLITYLKKSPCISALTRLSPLTDTAVSRNKKELKEWCSLMKADKKDLALSLSAILMGLFIHNEVVLSSKETLNLDDFPVQKAIHEIQANICNRGSRRILPSTEHENPYQKISPLDLKWVDNLPQIVALQELATASEKFECVDCRYVEILDSMLYRFHHNVDDFGITTKFWKEIVRTPVNLNDFMTYVIHTDMHTIKEQEERQRDEIQLCKNVKNAIENIDDFSSSSEDFILPGSLKTNVLSELQALVEEKEHKNRKVRDKTDTTRKTKSLSTGGSSQKKSRKPDVFDAKNIIEDEPLKSEIGSYLCDYTLLKEEDPPHKIPVVDFNGHLLTSSGISTSFYSMDNLKVTVDQVQICDEEASLSAKICLNGHDLILHRTSKKGFSFLVNFKSGAVLACGSPCTYNASTDNDFYLMTEESEKVISCMRSIFNTKKYCTMSGNVLQKLCKYRKKDNVARQTSCTSGLSKTVLHSSGRKSKEVVISTSNTNMERKNKSGTHVPSDSHEMLSLFKKPIDTSAHSIFDACFSKRSFTSEIKFLKKYINVITPKFKVCSSKLHKYNCLKRIAPQVEIDLNDIIRFVGRIRKENKCRLSVNKRYKIKTQSAGNFKTGYDYDFRITLPSGLHLRNVVGEKGTSICQYYFQKGALCAPIFDEDCRLFLGNGTVTVKKDNGQFIIYCANGEIIKYETAFQENTQENPMFLKNIDPRKEMPRFLKHVRRNLHKLTRNHRQSDYMSSRRMWKRQVKKFFCQQNKHVPFSTIKFTFTTSDGRVLYYENGKITESSGYYVEKEDLIKMGQVIFRREDGTTSILTDEGHMQTTFSDGTKITVWCEIDSEPVIINLRDKFGPDCEDMGPFVKIVTCYQYEHPIYITLLSNGPDEKLMMRIPSGEIFDITNRHFLIGIDESTTLLANKEVIRFVGTPCDECRKYCDCDVYINQLYNPPVSIRSEEILLKVTDTYNKSFIVHYDGSSERNEEYSSDKNRCGHCSHKIQPPQAFFTLNRDLSGCALWTNDDYNKRLSEASDSDTNYLVFYVDRIRDKILSTEWKTFEKQHYNFRFVWPKSNFSYKDDIEEFDISTAAFVRQRIVKKIPKNTVRNLVRYIFSENVELFSHSRIDTRMFISSTKTTILPSLTELGSFAGKNNEKTLFERKIKKRNKECNDVIDQIIEYFVKKTGRYYRTKVYENFCGVKLMLDDEEEIFFLANFDTSSETSSMSNSLSTAADTESNRQNPSSPMELLKSRLSKSTSAVKMAVEVIKQLEMERHKENKPKSSQEVGKTSLAKMSDSKQLQKSSSLIPPSNTAINKPPLKHISISRSLNATKSIEKVEAKTSQRIVNQPASILKTSSHHLKVTEKVLRNKHSLELISSTSNSQYISNCDINLQSLAIKGYKTLNEAETFNSSKQTCEKIVQECIKTAETKGLGKSNEEIEKNENLQSIASDTSSTGELEAEKDIDIVCNLISQTLRRIKQEKFDDCNNSEKEVPQLPSKSHLKHIYDEDSASVTISVKSPSESTDVVFPIIQDLFNVPRQRFIVDNNETKTSNETVEYHMSACYSDFSFKNEDLADYGVLDDIQDAKQSISSVDRRSQSSVPYPDTLTDKKHFANYPSENEMTQEYYAALQHMQEDSIASVSSSLSVEESEDFQQLFIENTPSMIPLVNIRSLTIDSLPDLALMSVLSFMNTQGKTPSMKVLRSMSELGKDYDFLIVENTGIVTDKNKNKEVQTDIVYEDFRDDELE